MKIITAIFKRTIYGSIPYWYDRLFHPKSESLPFYDHIRRHGYEHHLFPFRSEYDNRQYPVLLDQQRGLHYIVASHTAGGEEKRLYFRRGMAADEIERYYRTLAIEQDPRSPHHYFDDFSEVRGKTFLDVGSAEGFTSLDVVEEAAHLYLFEENEEWKEALEATFAPWREKVTIVQKYIGDKVSKDEVTLDAFFEGKEHGELFLKMDIEGAERYAIAGARHLFATSRLQFAICTYHNNDEVVVPRLLRELGCTFSEQFGYFKHKRRSVVARGHN